MTKFLIALGVLGTLAAPAMAGRLDYNEYARPTVQSDIDYTATRAIQDTATVAPDNDKQRGDQGAVFGANGD